MKRGDSRLYDLVPFVAALALCGACLLVAAKKRFWMDELITLDVVTTPTLSACVDAVAAPLESNPPLYFVAAWGWAKAFGPGETSLRLLSSLCVALAGVVAYGALRAPFGRRAAALGVAIAFGLSGLVWEQNAEARPYALYLLCFALATAAHAALAVRTTAPRLIAATLANTALVHVHALGAAYVGALLLATLLAQLADRRFAFAAYLPPLLGWASFVWWKDALLADMEVGKPHSWIPKPALAALPEACAAGVPVAFCVVAILAVADFASRRAAGPADAAAEPPPAPDALEVEAAEALRLRRRALGLAAFGATVVVPVLAFGVSRVGTSIFLDRYFIPGVVGWATLLAAVASRVFAAPIGRAADVLAALLVAAALSAPIAVAVLADDASRTGDLPPTAAAHPDLPVAFETPHYYLPAFHYGPRSERFHYVLDWEAANAEGSDLNSTVDYKLLKSLKEKFPRHQIDESAAFLAAHPRFLVVDYSVRRWSEVRLESDPAYRVTPLGQSVSLVERVAAASSRPK